MLIKELEKKWEVKATVIKLRQKAYRLINKLWTVILIEIMFFDSHVCGISIIVGIIFCLVFVTFFFLLLFFNTKNILYWGIAN